MVGVYLFNIWIVLFCRLPSEAGVAPPILSIGVTLGGCGTFWKLLLASRLIPESCGFLCSV
jgi:hypothetical protein